MKIWPPEKKEEVYLKLIRMGDGGEDCDVALAAVDSKGSVITDGFILRISNEGVLAYYRYTNIPGLEVEHDGSIRVHPITYNQPT
jgi:hypothetical protein